MGFELGALLGGLNGSQSFETTNSWDTSSASADWSIISTDAIVHSSNLSGAFTTSDTTDEGYFKYDYTTSNDVKNRWWFEVGTHRIVSYFWETHSSATFPDATGVTITVGSESLVLSSGVAMQRHRLETNLSSSDIYRFEVKLNPDNTNVAAIYIDDILTAIDVIDLRPEWNLKFKDELFMTDHQTVGGASPNYVWGFNKKWDVPLVHVEEIDARLLNQWWQDMRPLLFTSDTSDAIQQFIVTMTNKETPMNNFSKMYHDEWKGTLKLAAFNLGLVF